jgi:hypothetical protein
MTIDDKIFIVLYNLFANVDNDTYNKFKNLNIYKKKTNVVSDTYYIIIICGVCILIICILISIFYFLYN